VRIAPLFALRVAPTLAARIAAPPYDVVSREEATRLAAGNALSFLRVTRSEIEFPPETDAHDPRVYARARQNLDRLVARGGLVREQQPSLYVYRLAADGHTQVGLAAGVHVDDYGAGLIRQHETTRPDKEDDRTRHALALGAHAEPVLLAYRGRDEIDRLARAEVERPALIEVANLDGVRHALWRVARPRAWVEAFAAVECAYVADGHHRSAAAWRAARRPPDPGSIGGGEGERDWFLAVLFPASQLRILPYNRLIRDLGPHTPQDLLDRLRAVGDLSRGGPPVPPAPGTFYLYLGGQWYRLALDPASIDHGDPVRSLDAALLQERVLGPVLGVIDPRADPRIDFAGGRGGTGELERRVDSGEMALAISMHPAAVEQLMAAADAGEMMPPKSTWFEPKLASGLLVHSFG
jgi:uncharacterized protein (DUF1015 family)